VAFLFGIDAAPKLEVLVEDPPASDWSKLRRLLEYTAEGSLRNRPERVKNRIVRGRAFKTLTRLRKDVAEVAYRPSACERAYCLVVVRQTIQV
jgi:hypothetical protein